MDRRVFTHSPLPTMNFYLDAMRSDDWPQVRSIYLEGIETGQATFETEAPDWEQWDSGHLPPCRLVARSYDRILGWAAMSPVSRRQVYAGVAEVSVYVAAEARGKGLGDALMAALVKASEVEGLWTLQASIFPENQASISLHLKHGFREVGRR